MDPSNSAMSKCRNYKNAHNLARRLGSIIRNRRRCSHSNNVKPISRPNSKRNEKHNKRNFAASSNMLN